MSEEATPQLTDNVYALYCGLKVGRSISLPTENRDQLASEAQAALESSGAELRGIYSTVGFKAETDILIWLIAPTSDQLQDGLSAFLRTTVGRTCEQWWTSMGVHRDAEFNKAHVPAYLMGEEPRKYLSVYPFVRSLEWYLLEPQERSDMLREHGLMARPFPDVRANTVSGFALGDYEWLLAFEADELTRIVDLMRELRAAKARQHMREELPFITGIRKPFKQILSELP